jgi:cytochrome b561
MWRNTTEKWGMTSKLLHWLMALLIMALVALGWCAKVWEISPLKLDLFVWHKSLGIVALVLVVVRLCWRLRGPVPAVKNIIFLEQLVARCVHFGLYVVMIIMPLSGWVITSAAHIPVKLFWLIPLPFIVEQNKALADLSKQIHWVCMVMLVILLCLHIAAAIKHHVFNKDDILKKMWF